jgi:hypothetical protein
MSKLEDSLNNFFVVLESFLCQIDVNFELRHTVSNRNFTDDKVCCETLRFEVAEKRAFTLISKHIHKVLKIHLIDIVSEIREVPDNFNFVGEVIRNHLNEFSTLVRTIRRNWLVVVWHHGLGVLNSLEFALDKCFQLLNWLVADDTQIH